MIGWYKNEIKSDKKCQLYDRKTEKVFRPLLEKFVEWLSSADYDQEDYGAEEGAQEEVQEEAKTETEEQAKQRQLVEEMKRKQQEALEAAKLKAEQIEESKDEVMPGDGQITDATKIAVEDDFDVDDI